MTVKIPLESIQYCSGLYNYLSFSLTANPGAAGRYPCWPVAVAKAALAARGAPEQGAGRVWRPAKSRGYIDVGGGAVSLNPGKYGEGNSISGIIFLSPRILSSAKNTVISAPGTTLGYVLLLSGSRFNIHTLGSSTLLPPNAFKTSLFDLSPASDF